MIGNPKWFKMRKYGGWGLTPATWQGWAYIAVFVIVVAFIGSLKLPGQTGTILILVLTGTIVVDTIDMMRKIDKDEREKAHEAIAERNAMWFIIAALAAGVAFQAATGVVKKSIEIDPVILIALIGAVITKAMTHLYLRNK